MHRSSKKKFLITAALPYANSPSKHLGNLIGSILPADAYARYLRMIGEEVLFLSGIDEHGTPIELAAKEDGKTTKQFVDDIYAAQIETYKKFKISFDHFGRTHTSFNETLTNKVFSALLANGFIECKPHKQAFSENEGFLQDRMVVGTCPKPECGYDHAYGDQCEKCGALLSPEELLECRTISGKKDISIVEVPSVFLKMSALERQWQLWALQTFENSMPSVKSNVLTMIPNANSAEGATKYFHDRCISRMCNCGFNIPLEDFKDQKFYVWFTAPLGYISMAMEWADAIGIPDAWIQWFKPENMQDVLYTQFMAKDNIPFHTSFFPMMMLGANLGYKLVDNIQGYQYLQYDGGKFSTSQKRGIFCDQALDIFPSDYWRFYLLYNIPEKSDFNFTFEDFALKINTNLCRNLGNFINRLNTLLVNFHNQSAEAKPTIPAFEADLSLQKQLYEKSITFDTLMKKCSIKSAVSKLVEMWDIGNRYLTDKKPWDFKPGGTVTFNECVNIYKNLLKTLHVIAFFSFSIIPDSAEKIFSLLKIRRHSLNNIDELFNCFQEDILIEPFMFHVQEDGQLIAKDMKLFELIKAEDVIKFKRLFSGIAAEEVQQPIREKGRLKVKSKMK